MQKFELEHWPNPFGRHALMRMLKGYIKVYIFFGLLFVVCFGLYFYSKNYMGFAIPYTKMGTRVAIFGMLLGPIIPFISYLQRNKKFPSYAINEEGFLLNERGWDAAFFTWDEIKDVRLYEHPKFGQELHFEFVSFTKAMNKEGQEKFAQSLNREYVTQKHPKKISPELVKGDLTEFIKKFQVYYESFKEKFPIAAEEAFEIGRAYLSEYHLGFEIHPKQYKFFEKVDGATGSFFAFPLKEFPDNQLMISLQKQEVEGLKNGDNWMYPHKVENHLTREECIEIVKQHLGPRLEDTKIRQATFCFDGVYEYEKPCWIVNTKNLKATMEGTYDTDYFIDAVTKKVEKAISM